MRVNLSSISKALEMYYSKVELGTKDIMDLFNCSRSAAENLKSIARKKMAEGNLLPWNKVNVLTDVAFSAWGLDIDDLEKRQTKLSQLKRRQVI